MPTQEKKKRRRLFGGKGKGKAKKQNAHMWDADACPCCDDEAHGDLDEIFAVGV